MPELVEVKPEAELSSRGGMVLIELSSSGGMLLSEVNWDILAKYANRRVNLQRQNKFIVKMNLATVTA